MTRAKRRSGTTLTQRFGGAMTAQNGEWAKPGDWLVRVSSLYSADWRGAGFCRQTKG